ncbi:hypothetical protein HELRODRAFT_110029 [Helobdella robusta]|uniref:Major facilitator superfamily (MFS) profile domain-containing protein n=1 Tax=Helobdella robusta TaxID=6412 RepID=T1EEY4_HELRO|nr:hypothetical protein HELRODRAFT_110029 [Helobdella robusta]ESO09125.1 hypothetical protein HELRODRAFT_110029 [Helobdella robusta]
MDRTMTTSLSLCQKLSFSLGHFYNDLCSTMWFTYLLIFLTDIIGLSNEMAGYLLLLGQVVDAVSTPFLGYESDAANGLCGYSKRKSWHLLGTIFVTCSFTFLFLPCFGGANAEDWAKFIYYSPFVILFQFGWAAVQIAHMTLVTELTPDESERVGLNSYRNAMTLFANVLVYGIAWSLFHRDSNEQWSQQDTSLFMILMFAVVAIGVTCTIFFHIFTKEPGDLRDQYENQVLIQRVDDQPKMEWADWLKEPQFYLVGICYMFARLISNVSQTYWPFYIIDSLHLTKQYAAIIPLVVFVSGFITSLLMRPLNKVFGRKPTFLLGSIVMGMALLWMAFLDYNSSKQVFGSAVIIGVGSTTLLVTALSMVADVIGEQTSSSAFVYGVMSFGDKLSSGVTLMLIQLLEPHCHLSSDSLTHCPEVGIYFQRIMVYLMVGFTGVCFLLYFFLLPFTLGVLRKYDRLAGYRSFNGDPPRDFITQQDSSVSYQNPSTQ